MKIMHAQFNLHGTVVDYSQLQTHVYCSSINDAIFNFLILKMFFFLYKYQNTLL